MSLDLLCLLNLLKISCGSTGVLLYNHIDVEAKVNVQGCYLSFRTAAQYCRRQFWIQLFGAGAFTRIQPLSRTALTQGLILYLGTTMAHCFAPRCLKCSIKSPCKDTGALCCLALLGIWWCFAEQFGMSCTTCDALLFCCSYWASPAEIRSSFKAGQFCLQKAGASASCALCLWIQ